MTIHRCSLVFLLLLFMSVAVACSSTPPTTPVPADTPTALPTDEPASLSAARTDEPVTVPVEATMTAAAGADSQGGVSAGETAAVPAIEPIEVTYFTPSQQEGPYYTVEKPADRDNDLVDFAGAAGLPAGQILEFSGVVYDANGMPIPGIVVEIWQTDSNGVYLHPNDPGFAGRDPNFQGYGEAVTAADGSYRFRTVLPGLYEPRPRHIHVKVRLDGQELLTTQFYFAGEIDLRGDDAAMLIATRPGQDAAGNPILVGERDIVLNVDLSNR